MIKEYFKLFWRKTLKNKGFTLINITGLSTGIAVFILIVIWALNEFSYDRFNKHCDNIYRVEVGGTVYMVSAAALTYKNEFPEIEKSVRFSGQGGALLSLGDKSVFVQNYVLADSTLFDIFSYEFIAGNPAEALKTPFSIVLTESTVEKLFGKEEPMGKTLKIHNRYDAVITGVIRDVKHTHMPVDAIGSFVTLGKLNSQPDFLHSFGTSQYPTYFLISKGTDPEELSTRMSQFTNDFFTKLAGKTVDESESRVELVPLKEVYFHQPYFLQHLHGNLKFLYIFLLVSFLTLVIACINFINLTMARSETVMSEVGVKKAFGVSARQLFFQFLAESVVLCFVSSLAAVILIYFFIPVFNNITGGNLSLKDYLHPVYILSYFIVIVLVGTAAGIYPAIRLSSLNPVVYFRKYGGKGSGKSAFRTGLVIFQFTISTVLVLSVFIIISQLNYMKKFDRGFDDENVLTFRLSGDIASKQQSFRNEVLAIPGIRDIAFSSAVPGETNNFEGFEYAGSRQAVPVFTVDPSFLALLGIRISEGRNFSWERPSDRYGACILNSEAVRLWGIEEPVGKFLKHTYYLTTIPENDIEIIGVIDDYHYISPRDSVRPALFCYGDWFSRASLKIDRADLPETLAGLEKIWSSYAPGFPFNYMFLDESYNKQYKSEATLNRILVWFSIIALMIGCLGLLGLTSFYTQERTKEIGVRKVFGSTGVLIIRLLSFSFLRWVLIALVLGMPASIIIMNKWLSGFANHTGMSWWLFALGAIVLLSIAFLTILYRIIKVSRTNPVSALKYE
ncbi:MAG TPA: ABC transporter permease [Bacteroidales bacterium]|jgi:putative ABC transport system permease protein|nr:ABC transporter permease [Bacteroidales bacterium]